MINPYKNMNCYQAIRTIYPKRITMYKILNVYAVRAWPVFTQDPSSKPWLTLILKLTLGY